MTIKQIIFGIALVGFGIALGWFVFSEPKAATADAGSPAAVDFTCAMHPHIHSPKPGDCPLCGMELTPGSSTQKAMNANEVMLSLEALRVAQVQTTAASTKIPAREIELLGRAAADLEKTATQALQVGGRLEQLYVQSVGQRVAAGQAIAELYSPELLSAQQEFLSASKNKQAYPEIYQAAYQRLLSMQMAKIDIDKLEKQGKANATQTIRASAGGIATSVFARRGEYLAAGSPLFQLGDLSTLWGVFDVYENDLAFLKIGDWLDISSPSLPAQAFRAKIEQIEPALNSASKIGSVRVSLKNTNGALRPEMQLSAVASIRPALPEGSLAVPSTAVLWTGKRSLVYVRTASSSGQSFALREIGLGYTAGGYSIVTSGLQEGEEVVSQGVFAVDAAAQLDGRASMLNQPDAADLKDAQFKAYGLCEMCKERIEQAALSSTGVKKAEWDDKTGLLHIKYSGAESAVRAASAAIAKMGHDTEFDKAINPTYESLPGCCQYR